MDLVKKAKGKDAKKAEKPANEWTVAEVSKWISSFAFGKQYKAAFEEHEIAGDTLRDIDDSILNDELGIENARHRKRLLAEINDVLRKAGAGPSANDDDDSDDDSSSDDDSDDDVDDEPESKKAPKSKPKRDNAFNFPSDDEEEEKRSDSAGAKKSNSTKKRKDGSNSSQSSSASKKKAPKKVARRMVKSKSHANGVAKKSAKKLAAGKGKKRGVGRGSARRVADTASNGEVVPTGKMVCPTCGALIDKDCAMCMTCFAVFPEKKTKQFGSTSYYRAYRAVPNYRS